MFAMLPAREKSRMRIYPATISRSAAIELAPINRCSCAKSGCCSELVMRCSADRLLGASANIRATLETILAFPPVRLRQAASVLAATVAATTSGDAAPISSKAMIKKRRQIAEPPCSRKVSAALSAISTSPRRIDFCSRLLATHLSVFTGPTGGCESFSSDSSLCFTASSASVIQAVSVR